MNRRVVLIESHPVVREGLKGMLSATEFTIVAEAADVDQGMQILRETSCDVLMFDIDLPNRDGLQVLQNVRQNVPTTKVLIFTSHGEQHYVAAALRARVDAYVTKDASTSEILSALRKISCGG